MTAGAYPGWTIGSERDLANRYRTAIMCLVRLVSSPITKASLPYSRHRQPTPAINMHPDVEGGFRPRRRRPSILGQEPPEMGGDGFLHVIERRRPRPRPLSSDGVL